MAEGKNNAAIAQALFVTERSVEKVIHSIFVKLGIAWEPEIHKRVKAVILYLAEEPVASSSAAGSFRASLSGETLSEPPAGTSAIFQYRSTRAPSRPRRRPRKAASRSRPDADGEPASRRRRPSSTRTQVK